MKADRSDHIGELAGALAKAQAAMENAKFNRENPHFKSKYADLASIRDATVPHLSANGLSITQIPGYDEAGNYVLYTLLLHTSDQWISSVIPLLLAPDKPQAMMSSLTYTRRGGWASLCGMATEDDDGNVASSGKTVTPSQLDELMQLAEGGDMSVFLPWASERLGYELENLNMVRNGDVNRVRTWLMAARKKDAQL